MRASAEHGYVSERERSMSDGDVTKRARGRVTTASGSAQWHSDRSWFGCLGRSRSLPLLAGCPVDERGQTSHFCGWNSQFRRRQGSIWYRFQLRLAGKRRGRSGRSFGYLESAAHAGQLVFTEL
jgi:hypothetical protein